MHACKDNFLDAKECHAVMMHAYKNKDQLHGDLNFVFSSLEECAEKENFESRAITFASEYFDLSSMIGYEIWYNIESVQTEWHVDKDEKKMQESNILSLPLCTITFYPYVERNMGGGELLFRDYEIESIKPETNRIACFDAGVTHRVNEFGFKRISVIICPWSYQVEKFNGEKYQKVGER